MNEERFLLMSVLLYSTGDVFIVSLSLSLWLKQLLSAKRKKMPRKKVTDISGNGGVKKKRTSGKRKERDFSSDDEFDFEQENNKKPGKPAAKSGLQPVTVADDVKEKIVGLKHGLITNMRILLCLVIGGITLSVSLNRARLENWFIRQQFNLLSSAIVLSKMKDSLTPGA